MKGSLIILEQLHKIPTTPGVYKMMDEKNILYIGKAKNLKVRLTSYTKPEEQTQKNKVMLARVLHLEYEVVRTEEEALILESSLIKKYQPPFNILLKDDKSNPYIVLSKTHPFPAIFKNRGKPIGNDEFFGPFADKTAMESIINTVCKTFKIRTCSDEKFKTTKRPCLEYQINRCTAPCVNFISKEEYGKNAKSASDFLSGKFKDVVKNLKDRMLNEASLENFEVAGRIRDQIQSITKLLQNDFIDFKKFEDVDSVLIDTEGGQVAIALVVIRGGLGFGSRIFFPAKTEDESLASIMEFFLMRYYTETTPPKNVVLNIDVNKEIAKVLKCKIWMPKTGIYKDLIDFAKPNLEEKLRGHIFKKDKVAENLKNLANLLELSNPLERIEIYDNSHTSGSFMLGAMVVFSPDGFLSKEYRKFNAKFANTKAGDDYGMLRETLKRRFLNERMKDAKPDLIIIDGGKGQFSVCRSVLLELNIEIPFICIAKGKDRNAGKEWFFYKDREFQLEFTSPLLYFLQNLRDEAHRFAITSHRKRREKI
jgi:excinuclease ABC subunit C